jgi:probable HAF family extracellular repeat protein
MKIIPDFNIRGFMLTAAFLAGLGFGISAFALEHAYLIDLNSKTATELDTLGGSDRDASGINDAGQVAGFSNTAGGAYHAFITGHDGMGTRDLGTLGDGSYASDINDAGQVAGWFSTADGTYASHAFITGPNGMGMRDLGTLSGTDSRAFAINNAAQVAGVFGTPEVASHAFITGPNGMGMRNLGTLGGNGSYAADINDAGQVVGSSTTAEGTSRAFITEWV